MTRTSSRSVSRRRLHSSFAAAALLVLAAAPLALASPGESKAKKKGPQSAPSASASSSAADDTTPAPAPEPAATTPAAGDSTAPAESATAASAEDVADDITNTVEEPGKSYHFVGVRYRGTVIPAFLEHLFVDDGATVYSNSIGAEVDFRKDAKSTIVWLQYTEYGFGNTLFLQKGQQDMASNYTIVNSQLKGVYIGVDELWSSPIANHWDFEYGFGLGLGAIFGNLYNDWVQQVQPGASGGIKASDGNYYAPCNSQYDAASCTTNAHQNATTAKVGNYVEPNWFNGGAVPVLFPHIAGQVGVRWKPIKQLQMRLGAGIQLTGFWFGISADYGIESSDESHGHPAATPPQTNAVPGDSHQ